MIFPTVPDKSVLLQLKDVELRGLRAGFCVPEVRIIVQMDKRWTRDGSKRHCLLSIFPQVLMWLPTQSTVPVPGTGNDGVIMPLESSSILSAVRTRSYYYHSLQVHNLIVLIVISRRSLTF